MPISTPIIFFTGTDCGSPPSFLPRPLPDDTPSRIKKVKGSTALSDLIGTPAVFLIIFLSSLFLSPLGLALLLGLLQVTKNNELNYSGAQFMLAEKWALVGEVVGVNHFNGRHGDDLFPGLIGTYYSMPDKIIWDVGLEIGMNTAAPDFRLTLGLTWLFIP